MLTRWADLDHSFALFDELFRRRADRAWSEEPLPRLDVLDDGASFVVTADVPGIAEKDLTITLHDGTLTIAGTRKAAALEGYEVHRRERGQARFSRSFTLPAKVDGEKTTATLKDGVLTVKLAKAESAKPRTITVKNGN
jgi:HSP20 family protein